MASEAIVAKSVVTPLIRSTPEQAKKEGVTVQAIQQRIWRNRYFTRKSSDGHYNWILDPDEIDREFASLAQENQDLSVEIQLLHEKQAHVDELLASLRAQIALQAETIQILRGHDAVNRPANVGDLADRPDSQPVPS